MEKFLESKLEQCKRSLVYMSENSIPEFDLIVATMRPTLKELLVKNINQQTIRPKVISIVIQNYSKKDEQFLRDNITNVEKLVIIKDDDITHKGGTRHNIAMEATESNIIANFDDDDTYHPNYLKGMLYYQIASDGGMATKTNIVARDELRGWIGWLLPDIRDGDNIVGAGCCMMFSRDCYNTVGGFIGAKVGYDSNFMRSVMREGFLLKAADPFNFLYSRGRPEGNTWTPMRTAMRFNNIKYDDLIIS